MSCDDVSCHTYEQKNIARGVCFFTRFSVCDCCFGLIWNKVYLMLAFDLLNDFLDPIYTSIDSNKERIFFGSSNYVITRN